MKNPGLGFSIAGGLGSPGNPFREDDVVSTVGIALLLFVILCASA